MPELPEVETIRAQLDPLLRDARITQTWAFEDVKFAQAHDARSHRILEVGRRGKYLILGLAADANPPSCGRQAELVIHLGMTGRLSLTDRGPAADGEDFAAAERPPHRRAEWALADGRVLEFTDIRRFGRIAVVEPGSYGQLPTLAALGPEPFSPDFTPELLHQSLRRSKQTIKTQLMSQRVVAGLGNIYVDEALWLARVDPRATRISKVRANDLRDAIRHVLETGIRNGGTTLRDYRDAGGGRGSNQDELNCYGRAGLPCNRCGTPLARTVIGGRSTTYCPLCQGRR